LLDALGEVQYTFQKLKSTAGAGCTVEQAASCMEDSTLYLWSDMVGALAKVATSGIAGSFFEAGDDVQGGHVYGLANLAAFLAQTMHETIQYDACDENNWSDASTVRSVGGTEYTAAAACGQLGQSYQDYTCSDMVDPQTGELISAEDLQCTVDPNMVAVAETSAGWYGAPGPLFCAPRSLVPAAPRWDYGGWCPSTGASWDQAAKFDPPFDTASRGAIHYGPGASTAHVPPEVLSVKPSYLDYVVESIDQGTGESCLLDGTCCMDVANQRAGSWRSCEGGGCPNGALPELVERGWEARTDVEGCCWWGRGAIQTTGVCNFGKLNYFLGAKAAAKGKAALYPQVDFCRDPGAICRAEHPDLKWVAGFFYWLNDVQPYNVRGGNYRATLRAWVDNGADVDDHSLVDFASGVVNRGCHDAPAEGAGGADPCGNGEVHAQEKRRVNFKHVWRAFTAAGVTGAPAGRRQLLFG